MEFLIGQRVIFKDIAYKGTDNAQFVNVICTVCLSENPHPNDFDYWIYNPARNYRHGVSKDNIKPLSNGQL